jgi:transposase
LVDAVDRVRRAENRRLRARGDPRLVGTNYWWLTNRARRDRRRWRAFAPLRQSALKTARCLGDQEVALRLWGYLRRGWALRAWQRWLRWALRGRLLPMRKAAESIRKYRWGILTAIRAGVTNALTEGMNSRIQELKRRAGGFRNRQRFREAIYFHLGRLDRYPACVPHTNS